MRNIIRGAVVLATVLIIALAGGASATQPVDLHCPDGGVKVESGSAGNDIVLSNGTSFCVKASTGNTGILVADGVTTLQEYLFEAGIIDGSGEQGRDVSYYVVYTEVTPSPQPTGPTSTSTPTVAPSVTPTPTSTPAPSASAPTSTPTPSIAPSTDPSGPPAPTPTSTAPSPSLPPTDTDTGSTSRDAGLLAIFVIAFLIGFSVSMVSSSIALARYRQKR